MKRLINALSFAVLAMPLLAATCESFEPFELDDALKNVAEGSTNGVERPSGSSAPHDQIALATDVFFDTNVLQQRR